MSDLCGHMLHIGGIAINQVRERECLAMVRWVVGPILYGGPIELFLVPASAP